MPNEHHTIKRETRRSFLTRVGGLGAAAALADFCGLNGARAGDSPSTLPALHSRPSIGPIDDSVKSVVAHIKAEEVISGQIIHRSLVGEMIEEGIRTITGKETGPDAWHALLKKDDVIGIKFNHVAAEAIDTTWPFASQLVDSLGQAGFAPQRIMLIEAPPQLARELKTKPAPLGWSGGEVSFGSGAEQLAAVLQEITAIINVPFLKTHSVAGMSGCLKNLSHALIRRPGRYHANGCAPFVGDIVALPQIRSKLRVNIVNALRAVFDGGPDATPESIWPNKGILVSKDPVAADAMGVTLLNDQRRLVRLPLLGGPSNKVPHLHAAASRGVGTDDEDYIRFVEMNPF